MNFVDILLYFVLPLAIVAYFFLKKKYSFFEEKGIPHVKATSWILGNMSGVGRSVHLADLLRQVYDECKGKDVIAGFYLMIAPSLIVTDLELVKQIFIKDFHNFMDRGAFVNEEEEPLTGNLFSIEGEKWRFLRNKLSPVFTSGKIKSMFNIIADKGVNFVNAIEKTSKAGSLEVKDISNRFTIDIISSCAFGMEANTLLGEHLELVNIFRQIFGDQGPSPLYFFFLFTFPKISKFLHLRQFNKTITDFFYDVIGGSIKQREANNVIRNDFLNMLIQLKNKGSIDDEISTETRKLTLDECVSQAFLFFFAGADTSSTAIAYAITELSRHSEIQQKLRDEILEKIERAEGEINYDNLHEMTYLNQVVNETLRKYPPALGSLRVALNDYKIPDSNHVIKKGVKIMIPTIALHHDDRYWKNPNDFYPDHFSVEETVTRPSMAFIPFGEGPRNCIGMRFAQINVKFAIATIIKNFQISIDKNKIQLPLKFDPKNPGLAPVGGFWVNFERI